MMTTYESINHALGGDLTPLELQRLVPLTPIFVGYRGSQTHGTYMPPEENHGFDDTDLLCVYIPPGLDYYFGLSGSVETGHDSKIRQFDSASYELRHFVRLIIACNPNLVSALWLDRRHWIHATPAWRCLVDNRALFSSRRAEKSFGGYAMSQLLRMTAYHDRGEESCCAGETFHTEECPLRPGSVQGRGTYTWRSEALGKQLAAAEREAEGLAEALETIKGATPGPGIDASAVATAALSSRGDARKGEAEVLVEIAHGRGSQKKFATGFMGAKRKGLVEKFGYDVKNAAHLLRLLWMGQEFLATGEMHVDRTGQDAEVLKEIKRGEWPIERVKDAAKAGFDAMDSAAAQSPLPEEPNRVEIERLLVSIMSAEKMADVTLAGHEHQMRGFVAREALRTEMVFHQEKPHDRAAEAQVPNAA